MDIITTSLTNPRQKTIIIGVIKEIHKNVADLLQYRPITILSKRLHTLVAYQKIKIINLKSYPLMATVTIFKQNIKIKTNIFAAEKKTLEKNTAEAPLLYHLMERLSGNGFILALVFAK